MRNVNLAKFESVHNNKMSQTIARHSGCFRSRLFSFLVSVPGKYPISPDVLSYFRPVENHSLHVCYMHLCLKCSLHSSLAVNVAVVLYSFL